MMFDPSFISAWHAVLVLAVMGAVAAGVSLVLRIKPSRLEVAPGIYAGGAVLAVIAGGAATFFLRVSPLAIGLGLATLAILIVGRIDEARRLSWRWQLLAQCCIALLVVMVGWTIPYVSNPFHDGVLVLSSVTGAVVAFVWIIACMNAMNFFDGADGVALSVGAIACLALAAISILPATQDPKTFTLALTGFAACSAFFFWNAPPAKIYLGTTGSWFIGLYIALVAMLGGGKIITTLVVLALPVLDAVFVIAHRVYSKKAPWKGDTVRHMHHRLYTRGFQPWAVVMWVGVCTAILACVSVVASTAVKLIVFCTITVVFFLVSSRMMKNRVL